MHLEEEEVLKILSFCRNIGVLVEGAPKGSYEVELVLAYYKNLSVFKRYFLPLQNKLPADTKVSTLSIYSFIPCMSVSSPQCAHSACEVKMQAHATSDIMSYPLAHFFSIRSGTPRHRDHVHHQRIFSPKIYLVTRFSDVHRHQKYGPAVYQRDLSR